MIIKCKMCGGDIQFTPGDTNGQCDHCGCTTTFPKLPDEQRTNLFNRANHFRRQCEFDKAMAAYEHILEEDDTDAEAHWGIVLSKFGIEYVEDPVTHERIPTCHRAQVISILSDEDYQNALKYAPDTYSREIYEKEAKRIAEIQKGILAISSQEKPYDVFICYKETDDSGSRTKDSTLAQEIYYQLTNEGYKVFFSRITLEDKLGQEYEPYIFAALNSAKVMLVVGTRPEFFNAVWVKNEWNRYLALMKNDRKRVLIPCYRDMDPYDLPEELSSLQSQDMGKIGFMQDIIHGVKKVLGVDKQNTPNVTVQAAGPGVASLHKRAVLFLEDNDWDSATEYFDRILDIDPEYAPAYIGKVQVKNKARREADLSRCREPISTDPDFQKAVRFADEKQKAIYNGYNRAIIDRIELERKEAAYREAVALENRAAVEADFLAAAKKYDSAGEIRDAKDRAANCRAKASSAKAEAEKAAAVYKAQMEQERKERAREEEERRLAEEKSRAEEAERQRKEEELRKENRKRALKIFSVIAAVVLIITGGYLVYDKVIHPKIKYDQAQALLNDGKLDEAYTAFNEMLDYGDSATKLLEMNYKRAEGFLTAGKLTEAKQYYGLASGYSDSAQQIKNIDAYVAAEADYRNNDLVSAGEKYHALGDFLDSSAKFESVSGTLYAQAKTALESKDYEQAFSLLTTLGDYSDCATLMANVDSEYEAALDLWNNGEELQAEQGLQSLMGWRDVDEKLVALRLKIADEELSNENYEKAREYYEKVPQTEDVEGKITYAQKGIKYNLLILALNSYKDKELEEGAIDLSGIQFQLEALGDFKDSNEQAGKIERYLAAEELYGKGKYEDAYAIFVALGDYLNSSSYLDDCRKNLYQEATNDYNDGNLNDAYRLFSLLSGYSDSADIAKKIRDDYAAAEGLLKEGKYDEANAKFLALYNYADSPTKAQESMYHKAESLKAAGSYDEAIAVYSGLGEYKDSIDKINICQYSKAESLLAGKNIDEAISLFEGIPEYSDSAERAQALRYEKAQRLLDAGDLQAARTEYEILGEYSNAPELLTKVLTEIADNSMANKDYASALSAYQGLEQTAEIQEREYKLAQICYDEGNYEEATSAYEKLGQYELSLSKLPIARYAWADQLFKAGEYEKAAEQFTLLGEMADSATRAKESVYQLAKSHLENKDYDIAKSYYASIPGYSDADTMCKECDYRKATDLLNEGKNKDAETIFKALGEYSDSKTKAEQCIYNQAEILFGNKKYEEAKKLYDTISYSDSADKAKQCIYNVAEALFVAKDYTGAKEKYASIDYLDSKDRAKESAYQEAGVLYEEKKYAEAETIFLSIAGFNDSDDRAKDCHLQQGIALMDAEDYRGALEFLETVEYENSADLAAKCHYELGRISHLAGRTDEAVAEYAYAVSLQEARSALLSAAKDYSVINEPEKAIQTLWLIRNQEDAQSELFKVAETATKNEKYDLAILAYSLFEEHPEINLVDLYQKTSYDSIKALVLNCSLLADGFEFKEYSMYHFGSIARDYGLYDVSAQAFSELEEYSDAATQLNETYYLKASAIEKDGDQESAYAIFISLGTYRDSFERANKPYYDLGITKKIAGEWDAAIAAFMHAGTYSDAPTQILATRYSEGEAKRRSLDWDGAVDAFTEAGTYSDASTQILATRYAEGKAKRTASDWDGALEAFNAAGDYNDTDTQILETRYQQANDIYKSGDYSSALINYQQIAGYKDVDYLLENDENLKAAAVRAKKQEPFQTVGKYVTIGTYPQTSEGKDRTPIQWLVLDYDAENNKSLLLSRYGLDYLPYYHGSGNTWETCSLRSWLNKDFLNSAFSQKDQSAILLTQLNNKPEKNTTDKVFLLSSDEAYKYFGVEYFHDAYVPGFHREKKACVAPTAYALNNAQKRRLGGGRHYTSKDGTDSWWLRSPGDASSTKAAISDGGIITYYYSTLNSVCIRPAIWLNLKW